MHNGLTISAVMTARASDARPQFFYTADVLIRRKSELNNAQYFAPFLDYIYISTLVNPYSNTLIFIFLLKNRDFPPFGNHIFNPCPKAGDLAIKISLRYLPGG